MSHLSYPSEFDLLNLFGAEPARHDGVVTYTVADSDGLTISFSFNQDDNSVETRLALGSNVILTASCEKLVKMWVDGVVLRATFDYGDSQMQLYLTIFPLISITWAGLRSH
jgi:hypothetical protein